MTGSERLRRPDVRVTAAAALSAGVLLGLAGFLASGRLIAGTWSYCTALPVTAAHDLADDPRFGLAAAPTAVLYCLAFPLGFAIGALFVAVLVQPRRRPRRTAVAAGVLLGLLALAGAAGHDLSGSLSPPHGHYRSDRCPLGRPPWWPAPLPLRFVPGEVYGG